MLTQVKAFSSWRSAPSLLLDESGRPETDLIQIVNIAGLDPVKASVGMSPRGTVDGESYTGSSIPARNIVLTIRPNPDWHLWSHESLRKLLYSYFMPKRTTYLVFYSSDTDPVEISGIVESVDVNQFSKEPEFLVSIMCPDPYFTALDPKIIAGTGSTPIDVDYQGSVETGIHVRVSFVSGTLPTAIKIQDFIVAASVDASKFFEMNSVPLQKYVQNVSINTGVITNLLPKVEDGSVWPVLEPGINSFSVVTDHGVQDWELTYYERFGGL